MADTSNFAICARERDNLKKQRAEQEAKESEIRRLVEQVDVRNGEIAYAENTLLRLKQTAANIGDSAIEAAVSLRQRIKDKDLRGAREDVVKFAIELSNEIAGQQAKLDRLRDQLRNETWQLNRERDFLEIIETDIRRTLASLKAHNCW